jgi:Tol biopolymer transport system component
VKIWDLRTEKAVKKIGFFAGIPSNLLWSPDGKTLAVQSVGESYFVDLFKIDCCNE